MTADYLYFGLHLRRDGRRLFIVDPDGVLRESNEYTPQEMELVSGFLRVAPHDLKRFAAPKSLKCIEAPCDQPLHVTASGRPCYRCQMHQQVYDSRRHGIKRQQERKAKAERIAAMKPVKVKAQKPVFCCAGCGAVMKGPKFEKCRECRREDRLAAALARHTARVRSAEANRAKVVEAAKPKPIDYTTNESYRNFVACKECIKYVPRAEAVAKHYCSEKCRVANHNRRRGYQDMKGDFAHE